MCLHVGPEIPSSLHGGKEGGKERKGRRGGVAGGGAGSLVNASSSPEVKRERRPVSSVCLKSVKHPRTQSVTLRLGIFFFLSI